MSTGKGNNGVEARRKILILATTVLLMFILLGARAAEAQTIPFPRISFEIGSAERPEEVAQSLQILLIITLLSLAPAILMMLTSFTRVIVVLSFMRSALATQQMPPNQVLVGLALFLTFFIMAPTWQAVNREAVQPYMKGEITQQEALKKGMEPIREFLFKQTREKDLALFVSLAQIPRPRNYQDIPNYVLIPAFTISELKTAFQIGFVLYIPFLVIDMIVASTLMSMGMLMLPPMMISLPFKILLFIMVDGWHLLVRSLVMSFS